MIRFEGFTKKQKVVLNTPLTRLMVFSGAVRSGKTFSTYFLLPLIIGKFRRVDPYDETKRVHGRGILLGKTLGTIEENILAPMRELFGAENVGDIKGDASGNRYTELFGAKVRCVGANDKKSEGKIRGATYSWAVCDEVSLYPQNVFAMLMARLSEPNAKCVCTTNPEDPNHWFKVRYIDNKNIDCVVYNFTIDDNPYLDKEYVENLKKIYAGTELYDRLILGMWVSSCGAIYKRYIADPKAAITNEKKSYVDCSIGIDFGENKSPTVFICTGLMPNYEGVVVLEEKKLVLHGDVKKLQAEFIKFVKMCFNNGWRPTRAFFDNAQWTLGRSLESAALLEGLPLIVKECTKDKIKERIHLEQVLFGKGWLKMMSHCENIILAFKQAVYSEKGEQDERLDIVGENNPIDLLDAFEYSIQKWSKELLRVALYY